MNLHSLIETRRKALGLTDTDVAQRSGLSIYEYGDIEQHEKELFTVTALHQVRRLAGVLGLSLDELLAAAEIGPEAGIPNDVDCGVPRNAVIRQRRQAVDLSREQLTDVLGYDTDAVDALENDPTFLENWSLDLIVTLAKGLQIPVKRLLEP